jgi:hypothetical protein
MRVPKEVKIITSHKRGPSFEVAKKLFLNLFSTYTQQFRVPKG